MNRILKLGRQLAPFQTRAMSNGITEELASMLAAAKQAEGKPTIFDKILDKSIPSEMVFETEDVYCFRDINPQAPTHVLCSRFNSIH
jgi:hypothetical protein|tara:strand:- start:176 stop:436 length:261 start_codon:yes stop_codon:yes gene_type:complete